MNTSSIKAVAFDVDGTLIDFSLWGALNELFGYSASDQLELERLYVRGQLPYHAVIDRMTESYRKKTPRPTRKDIDRVCSSFRFLPDAEEVVRVIGAQYPLALVSSGHEEYVFRVAERLGIKHRYAHTRFQYSPEGAFESIYCPIEVSERRAKVEALMDFGAQVGASLSQIVFVGDSVNDFEAFRDTGHGILIGTSTEEMRGAAWRQISSIRGVLDIL